MSKTTFCSPIINEAIPLATSSRVMLIPGMATHLILLLRSYVTIDAYAHVYSSATFPIYSEVTERSVYICVWLLVWLQYLIISNEESFAALPLLLRYTRSVQQLQLIQSSHDQMQFLLKFTVWRCVLSKFSLIVWWFSQKWVLICDHFMVCLLNIDCFSNINQYNYYVFF